jgi:hypothetical protein
MSATRLLTCAVISSAFATCGFADQTSASPIAIGSPRVVHYQQSQRLPQAWLCIHYPPVSLVRGTGCL